ncbi:MAG: hypothetical protein HQ582_29755 [Planctomycetes bacterium]|nr:hypothetical protein [Planctomycetota bacterium]
MSSEGTRAAVLCSACNKSIAPGTSVRLWDGRDYCRTCLDSSCPGLAQYAVQHESLQEEMPEQVVRDDVKILLVGSVRVFLAVSAFVFLLVVLAARGSAFLESFYQGIKVFLLGEAVILSIFSPIIAIFGYVAWRSARRLLPHTRAAAGRLRLRFGDCEKEVALNDCRWCSGKLHRTRLCRGFGTFSHAPAILIRLPGGSWFTWPAIVVGVGYTAEMRARWKALLTLAGVPTAIAGFELVTVVG